MWEKGIDEADQILDGLPPEGRELYGETIVKVQEFAGKVAERGSSPDRVARAVEHALTARRPRTRYLVGADARVQLALGRLLPSRAGDALEARLLGI
jgi:hypothetical protein